MPSLPFSLSVSLLELMTVCVLVPATAVSDGMVVTVEFDVISLGVREAAGARRSGSLSVAWSAYRCASWSYGPSRLS